MQRSNLYVFCFALIISFFVSIGLALAATFLREEQDISARLDVIQNILSVAGFSEEQILELRSKKPEEVIALFREKFEARIVNKENEEVELSWIKKELEGLNYASAELEKKEAFELIELFRSKLKLLSEIAGKSPAEYDIGLKLLFLYKPGDEVASYIVPVEGYGLWDMIYGYIALEPDLNTVKDIRFYKHQETPGLGGECSQPWFTNLFKGKKILNSEGDFVSIAVVKGKAADLHKGSALLRYVDGISGGTITGKGITSFLQDDLGRYNKYFAGLRKNKGRKRQ